MEIIRLDGAEGLASTSLAYMVTYDSQIFTKPPSIAYKGEETRPPDLLSFHAVSKSLISGGLSISTL